jgi:hypothetical protein
MFIAAIVVLVIVDRSVTRNDKLVAFLITFPLPTRGKFFTIFMILMCKEYQTNFFAYDIVQVMRWNDMCFW